MLVSKWMRFVAVGFIALSVNASGFAQDGNDQGIADFPKLAETDWPWWRGPSREGKVSGKAPPIKLDESTLRWRVAVPFRGHSSPTIVGDQVVMLTADEPKEEHWAISYDRTTGKELWRTSLNNGGFPARNHPKNTEATPTIACDGERLFATLYHHDQLELITLSLTGEIGWRKSLGRFRPTQYEYGYAPSPVLFKDLVIVAAEWDGPSFIWGCKRSTGEKVWETKRPDNITFSTPMIKHIAGKNQMLISGAGKVSSYDPATGTLLWESPGTTAATCGTVVTSGDIVMASGGYPKPETIAFNASTGKELWKNSEKCYEQSMVTHDGHLYALTDIGTLHCFNATTGRKMWTQRLRGPVSSSPVIVGDVIYWGNELGTMYVFRATPKKFELIANKKIGNDLFPSPAVSNGELFIRAAETNGNKRQEYLYCFANK